MAAPKKLTIFSEFLETSASWRIAQIRVILAAHEQGDFSGSAVLAQSVLRDSRIVGPLQGRVLALTSRSGLPFVLEVSEGIDKRRAERVRDDMDRLWWTACTEAQLGSLHRDAILLGVSVGRDDMPTAEDGQEVPFVRRLRPNGLRWCESDRAYRYRDSESTDHVVTPGENGWLLHAPNGEDSWLLGLILGLGEGWLMRYLALRDYARFCEKHGMPVLEIEEPHDATDDVEREDGSKGNEAQDVYRQLGKLPQEAVLRMPQRPNKDEPGWKARWLELNSRSYEAFSGLRRDLAAEFEIAIRGTDSTTQSKGIGGDEASINSRGHGEYVGADAEALATTLRSQVWGPWAARNRGGRAQIAAYPKWQTRPLPDLAMRATTLNNAADAIAKLRALGIDDAPILAEFHLNRTKPSSPTSPEPPS